MVRTSNLLSESFTKLLLLVQRCSVFAKHSFHMAGHSETSLGTGGTLQSNQILQPRHIQCQLKHADLMHLNVSQGDASSFPARLYHR